MWPALWPLAMADLGKFTKSGASLLTMAIAGGAVMPWLRGVVQDCTSFQPLTGSVSLVSSSSLLRTRRLQDSDEEGGFIRS